MMMTTTDIKSKANLTNRELCQLTLAIALFFSTMSAHKLFPKLDTSEKNAEIVDFLSPTIGMLFTSATKPSATVSTMSYYC